MTFKEVAFSTFNYELRDVVDLSKELSMEERREIDNLYNTKLQAAEEL